MCMQSVIFNESIVYLLRGDASDVGLVTTYISVYLYDIRGMRRKGS